MSAFENGNRYEQFKRPRLSFTQPLLYPGFAAFNKYLETYADAFCLQRKKKQLQNKKEQCLNRLERIEERLEELEELRQLIPTQNTPRRKRRLADDIERPHQCLAEKCLKNYGTLGSLQQHQRLKHPDINFSQSCENIE